MKDPILEQSWEVREALFKRYGVDGLFAHLEAMDRARRGKAKRRRKVRARKQVSNNARSKRRKTAKV